MGELPGRGDESVQAEASRARIRVDRTRHDEASGVQRVPPIHEHAIEHTRLDVDLLIQRRARIDVPALRLVRTEFLFGHAPEVIRLALRRDHFETRVPGHRDPA